MENRKQNYVSLITHPFENVEKKPSFSTLSELQKCFQPPTCQALLVTLFLVLVNIFNTVTTNTPKVEGKALVEYLRLIASPVRLKV